MSFVAAASSSRPGEAVESECFVQIGIVAVDRVSAHPVIWAVR